MVKGALIEGRVLREADANALATLEYKEVSVARLAGMLEAPLARMSYLLRAPVQRIAFALAERGRQAQQPQSERTGDKRRPRSSTRSAHSRSSD